MESDGLLAIVFAIAASLAAMVIWQVVGSLLTSVRTPLQLARATAAAGVLKSFRSFQECRRDLKRTVLRGKSLSFLAVRGFPLTQETYALNEILEEHYRHTAQLPIRCLLADPDCPFARRRASEFRTMTGEREETYLLEIRQSVNILLDMKAKFPQLEVRLYQSPAIFRILLADDVGFLGLYTEKWRGVTSPVLMVSSRGFIYKALERYFEEIWRTGREACAYNLTGA